MAISEEEILRSLSNPGTKKELERFFTSKEYKSVEYQLSINNAKFAELADPLKLSVLYMNKLGLDTELSEFWRFMYRIKPVSMEEYFTPEYGGPIVHNLYPGWKKIILRDYEHSFARTVPNELVLAGAIGTGKTTIARFLHGHNLIKMCSLINPQATLNVTQDTLLVLALFTVTLDKASLALIKPFIQLLAQSPCFQQVLKVNEFNDFMGSESRVIPYVIRAKYVEFPNNVIINLGSKVEHAISYSMFGAMLDEAEFRGTIDDSFAVYTNLKERIRSRFLGSPYTLLTLISSARYSRGIIAEYIRDTSPDDPNTKIYSFPIWEIKHFESYDKGWFYVLRGTAAYPHRVMSKEEGIAHESGAFVVPNKCEVIRVPEVYRKDFKDRIVEALKNLAGIALDSDSSYIFTDELTEYPQLVPELSIESNLGDRKNLYKELPKELFNRALDVTRLRIAPSAQRYVHLDLAETGVASICVLHPELLNDRIAYVVDLLLNITTQTRIDMTEINNLISELGRVCHIAKFTTDQYQSTQIRQQAILDNTADVVALFSTVKDTEPYDTFARVVQNRQLLIGRCAGLRGQLAKIQIAINGDIIQPKDGAAHGDSADAVCGSLNSCIRDLSKAIDYNVEAWLNTTPEQEKNTLLSGYESI